MPASNPDRGNYLAGLPDGLRQHVLNQMEASSLLALRRVNKTYRNDVRQWGDRQVGNVVTDAPSFMASAPRQPGLPYPDMHETQRRLAVAVTASPLVASVNTTLGNKSQAAPNVPFKSGGGFTFKTPTMQRTPRNGPPTSVPPHEVEAHPGGGQHSGRTNNYPAIPSTPDFGGRYLKIEQEGKHKQARRFGMYGEFANTEKFWDPLGPATDKEFKDENLKSWHTGALVRAGASEADKARRKQLHAELLRRYEEKKRHAAKK